MSIVVNTLQGIFMEQSENGHKLFLYIFFRFLENVSPYFLNRVLQYLAAQHPHYLLQMASAEKGIN